MGRYYHYLPRPYMPYRLANFKLQILALTRHFALWLFLPNCLSGELVQAQPKWPLGVLPYVLVLRHSLAMTKQASMIVPLGRSLSNCWGQKQRGTAVRDEERASKRGAAPQMSPMRSPRRTTAADPQYLVGGFSIKRARVDCTTGWGQK